MSDQLNGKEDVSVTDNSRIAREVADDVAQQQQMVSKTESAPLCMMVMLASMPCAGVKI